MSKEQIYGELFQRIREAELYELFERDIVLKGNLAYLIDRYGEDSDWPDIYTEMSERISQKQTNELSWQILSLLYHKYLVELAKEEFESKVSYLALIEAKYSCAKTIYEKDKNLKYYGMVHPEFYPNWFITLERMESLLKGD